MRKPGGRRAGGRERSLGGLVNIVRVAVPFALAFAVRGGWIFILAFGSRFWRRLWRWFWA